ACGAYLAAFSSDGPGCARQELRLRWRGMKHGVAVQLIVAVASLLVGSAFLAAEYSLVKWYPHYQQRVTERTLRPVPVRDASLGVEVQVAAGSYGRVSSFPVGVRLSRPKLSRVPQAVAITSH